MLIEDLKIVHTRDRQLSKALLQSKVLTSFNSFHFASCQRDLWVFTDDNVLEVVSRQAPKAEQYCGSDAYKFLLRIACGLESEIIGETEVFGQLKLSWQAMLATNSIFACHVYKVMQNIFADTKLIRSRHLAQIGGVTYGSLTRKLMKGADNDTIMIVGAGQIAQEVAGYFTKSPLLLWNRDKVKLEALRENLVSKGAARIDIVTDARLEAVLSEAAHVILAVPMSISLDLGLAKARLHNPLPSQRGVTIHLGGQDNEAANWQEVAGFFSLSKLFALQNQNDASRQIKIIQAAAACQRKAFERDLASSVDIIHSWEDIPAYIK